MRHQADGAPQHRVSSGADVDPVDEHGAGGGVEEPGDELEQGRLAGAGAADDRRRLPGSGGEGDVGQHRVVGTRVVEADAAELDLAPGRRGSGSG